MHDEVYDADFYRPTDRSKFFRSIYSLLIVFFFLGTVLSCAPADAAVTLNPRVDASDNIVGNEDYVHFGQFLHKTGDNGDTDDSAGETPILWRVMELQTPTGGGSGAILLSHYNLIKKAFDDSGNDSNVWADSTVREWLNDTFFTGFSAAEQGVVLNYPYPSGEAMFGVLDKITLPSGIVNDLAGGFDSNDRATWPYEDSEIKKWFGDNDYQDDKGAGVGTYTNARKAHFKGATFIYDAANIGWNYWSRSPYASYSNYAYYVSNDGTLYSRGVDSTAGTVRPAFFLNLESVIFKSKSSDVFGSSPAAAGGSIDNPYCLFIGADILSGATVSGDVLSMDFAADIGKIKAWPAATDFTVKVGGTSVVVKSVSAAQQSLALILASPVVYGDTVTLSYTVNADATGTLLGGAILSGDTRLGAEGLGSF
ncbi:DUF6273 domain-containing protein, partial [Synergistaceae bacterium OttesenSCG-928-I11]|nr:DUF6273 domain-containing protein [Synergistaceae bacterium OttesenSCG-928-I11]